MDTARNRKPLKWRRILAALADGRRLTRFDAEHLGDHSLNSTIAGLEARGVRIAREAIVLEGRFGIVHCKRYWLPDESREQARRLLALGSCAQSQAVARNCAQMEQ